MIIIKNFENAYLDEMKQLKITEGQKAYVDIDLDEILAMAQEYPAMKMYAIFHDRIMIGFACFLLDDSGDMNLLKLMIDSRYQGKGYAKAALGLLLDMIRPFTSKGELWLSVHPQNVPAIALYKKTGFLQQQTQFDADDEIFFKYVYA